MPKHHQVVYGQATYITQDIIVTDGTDVFGDSVCCHGNGLFREIQPIIMTIPNLTNDDSLFLRNIA